MNYKTEYNKPVDIKKCREALSRFIYHKPVMCIPANPDDDDILIARALKELEMLRDELERLRREKVSA